MAHGLVLMGALRCVPPCLSCQADDLRSCTTGAFKPLDLLFDVMSPKLHLEAQPESMSTVIQQPIPAQHVSLLLDPLARHITAVRKYLEGGRKKHSHDFAVPLQAMCPYLNSLPFTSSIIRAAPARTAALRAPASWLTTVPNPVF